MNFNERIREYISYKKTNKSAFEKKCGLANGYINNVKGNPSEAKLRLILSAYPDIDPTWLLTGEGPMLREQSSITSVNVGDFNIDSPHHNRTDGETAMLKEKVKHLEEMLAEKERLINVLMKNQ